MRRLATFPALAEVSLPRSASFIDFLWNAPDRPVTIVASVDDADQEKATRRFKVLRGSGAEIPVGAIPLRTFRTHPVDGNFAVLFELPGVDVPPGVEGDLLRAYRTLIDDGFTLVEFGPGDKVWARPEGVEEGHISSEQIIALHKLAAVDLGRTVSFRA